MTPATSPPSALKDALLAVVASDEAGCERRAAPLRALGAVVRCALVQVSGLSTLSAPGFDAALLDVAADPEGFAALARALHEEPRTRGLPVVARVSPEVPARRLAGLGVIHVVATEDDASLIACLSELVAERRAQSRALEYARVLEERMRVALERLSAMRSEAQVVTHDARVLCGVVVGFAANLRDGIAGALDPMQQQHVAQILEAAQDTTALVDRFGATIRAQTDLPSSRSSAPPPSRRSHRRSLVDLADLAHTTLQLFETMAENKTLVTEVDAPSPVPVWCDAMQVKQVVTNLLVNAIKFTQAGGSVTLRVRSVAPAGAATGPGARHYAELVVRDTGPGIPREDRERVFDRGTRLARDQNVPGSGIGLAVVREMVVTHGGTVHVEDSPGGGAALVVRLPVDMRTRRDSNVVLIDDANAAARIVSAVRASREGSVLPLRTDPSSLSAVLENCQAVVVVPRAGRLALDQLLDGPVGQPPGGDDP